MSIHVAHVTWFYNFLFLFQLFLFLEKNELCGEIDRAEGERGRKKEKRGKMIYRKWSLLTGPAAILGGVAATVVVANHIFVEHDPFRKQEQSRLMHNHWPSDYGEILRDNL
ncbi:uncharacterized protein LOC130136817 [Syzygium oleosum]|uniref:uncharacterized protein LOC130136817 n=1 Tax=Syzygium oleosum TaxID=219896 RepID=UPI0024B91162|nr:uncharacterized protein LOC130136817 [Syzygium oleosum]